MGMAPCGVTRTLAYIGLILAPLRRIHHVKSSPSTGATRTPSSSPARGPSKSPPFPNLSILCGTAHPPPGLLPSLHPSLDQVRKPPSSPTNRMPVIKDRHPLGQ